MATERQTIKKISQHTSNELNEAIAKAEAAFPLFYVLLHGIDAYMERRRRRIEAAKDARDEALRREMDEELSDPWGHS